VLATCYAGQPGAENLVWLLPTVGLTALVGGLHSTAIYLRNRHLDLRPVVLLDLLAQLAGCTVGIAWCWFAPSLWALVSGVLVHQVVYTLGSWCLGPRNRLRWDRPAATAVVRFGRWIWLSTMLTWVAMQIDRLVLPNVLRFDGMAVYQVAAMIALAVPEAVHVLGLRVLFPSLADSVRRDDRARLSRLWAMRLPIVLPGTAVLLVLAVWGDVLVRLLYPAAFADAGWMLRVLAAAAIPQALTASSWYGFFALGRSWVPMCLQALRLALKGAAMWIGFELLGMRGVILGLLAAECVHYPLVAVALHRHGLLHLRLDLPVLAGSLAVVSAGFCARPA
jgi:O-antigen/teichoic acid export membrane protein